MSINPEKTRKRKTNTPIVVAVITAITSIFVALISGYFTLQASRSKEQALSENTALAQQVISGNATQSSLVETIVAPTMTLAIPLKPLPNNTATSVPSLTPTATIVIQPPGFTFSDDFELGLDTNWKKIRGMPGMANGKLTVIEELTGRQTSHFLLLDTLNWKNLRIETVVASFDGGHYCELLCANMAAGSIVIHFQQNRGGVGLIILPDGYGMAFATIDKTLEWTAIPSSRVTGDDIKKVINKSFTWRYEPQKVTVEVFGDTYIAYLNDKRVTSAEIPSYNNGQVGVWMLTNEKGSSSDVYAPRFEYITLESLP